MVFRSLQAVASRSRSDGVANRGGGARGRDFAIGFGRGAWRRSADGRENRAVRTRPAREPLPACKTFPLDLRHPNPIYYGMSWDALPDPVAWKGLLTPSPIGKMTIFIAMIISRHIE